MNRIKIDKLKVFGIIWCLLFGFTVSAQNNARWMQESHFGVMHHYLADWIARAENMEMNVETWNKLVDNFDVDSLSNQLHSVGAAYCIITIGQNSGYYLSPNKTYDKLTKINPSKCSNRDLVADLSAALKKKGIKMIVYLPAGAPAGDQVAREALHWKNGPFANKEFQKKWESVIREWSVRWGNNIAGWWFDGCYWPNTMYRSKTPPNFESFAAAAKAGNRKSVVAFNPGVINRTISITPFEDYIAGEISDPNLMSLMRIFDGVVDGGQLQILSYIGERWGTGEPRFTTEQILGWSQKIWEKKGAVTWDVPLQSNGTIKEIFLEQLEVIGNESQINL
jgi:hypothetical protein